MSDVNPSDLRLIESEDDVLHLYQGVGDKSKTGIEVELAFFDPASETLAPMSLCQNKAIKNAALAEIPGAWVNNEPTSETLEVNSIAVGADDLQSVLDDINVKISTLTDKATGIGLKRSYFQELPDKSAKELLTTGLMDVPRYQAFFGPPRNDMCGFAAYFSVCKSNQISVSPHDTDHMLANIRRLYFLAPFLFLATDNSAGFTQGEAFSGNTGMHYRHNGLLEGRGGVPSYVFTAKDGDDYIRQHIKHVMNNPLYVYYDENGELIKLPAGEWITFNELRERKLNTATNYFFAQTVLWPDVKIAALRDSNDEVNGHRYEARMFGVGAWQHQFALLLTAGLAYNAEFAAGTDQLLADFGFDLSDGTSTSQLLETAYAAARNHDGQFMNVRFGSGAMIEFARQFADLMEKSFEGQGFDAALAPFFTICRTGCTDGKINRHLFDSLDKISDFQRSYDPAIMADPNTCAHLALSQKIADAGIPCDQTREKILAEKRA